ncbi:MAG: hypothetical protein ACT4QA_04495 [Panacagrimonas sp.]
MKTRNSHPLVSESSPPLRRSAFALAVAGLFALPAAPSMAATLSVGSNGCTLVNAITNANADMDLDGYGGCIAGSGADTITLPIGTQTLTVVNNTFFFGAVGLPVITTDITIQGATGGTSSIVRDTSAMDAFGILVVAEGGSLDLQKVTISGAAVASFSSFFLGGAIINLGALTVSDCTVTGNSGLAGAILNFGSADLSNSLLSGNTAFIGGALVNVDEMTVSNSVISGNFGLIYGGASRTWAR